MAVSRILFGAGLFLCCVCAFSDAFMTLDDFTKNVASKCYNFTDDRKPLVNGQIFPSPNAIESFVSLVEKVEERYPSWKPDEVIQRLLLSFRYDDAQYFLPAQPGQSGYFGTRGGSEVSRAYDILNFLLGNPIGSAFREEDFTPDERCALYFMISHTVNDTVTSPDQEKVINEEKEILRHPIEQGVVSLGSYTRHAFALGKVLIGLLAGLKDQTEFGASDVYLKVKQGVPPSQLVNAKINVLYAATFGDAISIPKMHLATKGVRGDNYFLPNGYWQDAICNSYYALDDNNKRHVTYSLLRGAVDGFILGQNVKELISANRDLRLSQILRAYYSASGFPEKQQLSWCNRRSAYSQIIGQIKESSIDYDKLMLAVTDNSIVEENIQTLLDQVFRNILDNEQQIFDEATRENGECSGSESAKMRRCETPADFFAVLDLRSQELQRQQQYEILGNLTTGFAFGLEGSAASVFTNLKTSGLYLDTVLNESRCSGCASCSALHYNPVRSAIESETIVIQELTKTIDQLSDEKDEEKAGVPSKVVLYFNYGNPPSDYDLRKNVRDLLDEHREVRLLAFGPRKDALKTFVRDQDETDVEVSTNIQSFMPKLKEKVCRVPAEFQYKNCYRRTDSEEQSNIYEGFITPNSIQYWAMYPKYFHRSFSYKLKFKAVTGQIRVCHTRSVKDITETRELREGCQETSQAGGEITFSDSNPCHRYTVYNCRPFYFVIEGKTAPTEVCRDKRCRSPNQIQFEFSHEGISCNTASTINSWSSVAVWVVIAAIFHRLFPSTN